MKRRIDSNRSSRHYAAYFDLDFDGEIRLDEQQQTPDATQAAVRHITEACERWVARGNQVMRRTWGVETRQITRDERLSVRGVYAARGEVCDPLGVILDGQPSSCMPLVDAMRVLQVDEFWIVGFVHGCDRFTDETIGRTAEVLSKRPSYGRGHAAGQFIAAKFVQEETI